MPKIKMKRQNIRMDMTAMCDVAFLLLTFFILTTKFRPNEPVQVEIPASLAKDELRPDSVHLISIGNDGRIFFGTSDQNTRVHILDELIKRKNFQGITTEMQKRFRLLDLFGVPLEQVPQLLALSSDDMTKFQQPGLKVEPKAPLVGFPPSAGDDPNAKNDLAELIVIARTKEPEYRVAVKADKGTDYKYVDAVIETLRKTRTNRFILMTGARSAPE